MKNAPSGRIFPNIRPFFCLLRQFYASFVNILADFTVFRLFLGVFQASRSVRAVGMTLKTKNAAQDRFWRFPKPGKTNGTSSAELHPRQRVPSCFLRIFGRISAADRFPWPHSSSAGPTPPDPSAPPGPPVPYGCASSPARAPSSGRFRGESAHSNPQNPLPRTGIRHPPPPTARRASAKQKPRRRPKSGTPLPATAQSCSSPPSNARGRATPPLL